MKEKRHSHSVQRRGKKPKKNIEVDERIILK
jgi:hypothetical protein